MQMLKSAELLAIPAAARESAVVSIQGQESLDSPASSNCRDGNAGTVATAAIDYATFSDAGRWQASPDHRLWSQEGLDSNPVAAVPCVSITFGIASASASSLAMDGIGLNATGLSSLTGSSARWMIPIRAGVDYRF